MGFEAVYGIGALLFADGSDFRCVAIPFIAIAAQFEQVEKLFASATREMRRDRSLNFIDRPASTSPGGSPKGSSQTAPADSLCRIFLTGWPLSLFGLIAVYPPINEMNLWPNGEFRL